MIWLYRVVFWVPFIIAILTFLWLLWLEFFKKGIGLKTARRATFLVFGIFAFQMLAKMFIFYWVTKHSTFGPYLLKTPSFLKSNLWYIAQTFLVYVLVAVSFTVVAVIVYKLFKRPLFKKSDLWVVFATTLVAGYPDVLIVLIGALLLMILIQIIIVAFAHKSIRLNLIPFLIIATILVGILNNFNFYLTFLRTLHLI
ncbi:MAG: hypothetical protein ABSE91_01005 [Patescibacteria group bacterium]